MKPIGCLELGEPTTREVAAARALAVAAGVDPDAIVRRGGSGTPTPTWRTWVGEARKTIAVIDALGLAPAKRSTTR